MVLPETVPGIYHSLLRGLAFIRNILNGWFGNRSNELMSGLNRIHGPDGTLSRTWPTGSMVLWVAVLLAVYLILDFL